MSELLALLREPTRGALLAAAQPVQSTQVTEFGVYAAGSCPATPWLARLAEYHLRGGSGVRPLMPA